MFFWKRKRDAKDARRELQIAKLRLDAEAKAKEASRASERARKQIERLLGDDPAENIWYATGGDRRPKNVRR